MFSIFDGHPVRALFSTRADGQMSVLESDLEAQENRRRFLEKHDIESDSVVSAGIAYGSRVQGVGLMNRGQVIPRVDGLYTMHQDLPLAITACDCIPIYIYAPGKLIGVVHAGWQPLANDILRELMQHVFVHAGSPRDVLVAIGPGICMDHFEVKGDVAVRFRHLGHRCIEKRGAKIFVNLKAVAAYQLKLEGVLERNIQICTECTHCDKEKYFSFRRDKPERPQPMMAVMSFHKP